MNIAAIWFFIFFIPLLPITFLAFTALDFSKLFRANAVWQIRLIVLLISICVSFLASFAMYTIIDLLLSLF